MQLNRLTRYLNYYLRKKFSEKLIIIESDDWGMERGLTPESLKWAEQKYGKKVFSRWTTDALETGEDLQKLMNVLSYHAHKFSSPPVITANFITHNVDYESRDILRMRPITEGFNSESEDVRPLYKKAIEEKFIFPQLHGYAHCNLSKTEAYFKTADGREAFDNKFFTVGTTFKKTDGFLRGELSENEHATRIAEATKVFEKFFGTRSQTLIPPHFIIDKSFLPMLAELGISYLQAGRGLIDSNGNKYNVPPFWKMKKLTWGVRNARLDPHPDYNFDGVKCLKDIQIAFEHKQPAILDFHRVNFSGKFAKGYRDHSLKELDNVLKGIYKKWPDARFINSTQILDYIK
jgi:hypothetical protein